MDRRSKVLELVSESGRVEVRGLSERFGVSQVTIRKDLDVLERQGLIRREHGFAVAIAPDNLLSRLAINHDVKRQIAQAAAELVPHGATVMVESGSTCALLAAELAATRRNLTMITNSVFIADYVRDTGVRVVLLGGEYQDESQVTVGSLLEKCLSGLHVGLCFIGVDGHSFEEGFTGGDLRRVAASRAMGAHADQTVVLTESKKFGRRGAVALLDTEGVAKVVTDPGLAEEYRRGLRAAGVDVIVAGEPS